MMRGQRWTDAERALVREKYPAEGLDGCTIALPERERGVIAQLAFRLGVRQTANLRARWTETELDILRRHYPQGGAQACLPHLPGREKPGIDQQALRHDLKDATAIIAGLRAPLAGGDLDRALRLRQEGWSYPRIAREFGVAESTATNAVLIAECIAAGFAPAKRDATGGIVARDVKRMRTLMMAGEKGVDIQRQLGVSASCVSHHRRRLEADLRAERKGKTLPPPGAGSSYSGRKIDAAVRRQAEALFQEGFGSPTVAERTGISHSQCLRIRSRMVKRLARRRQTLPGCDASGRRHTQKSSARFVPHAAIAELQRRLIAREPVSRAARDLGIGGSTAYRIRDALARELEARGEQLLPPIRGGRSAATRKAAAVASWMPKGAKQIYRFRALCRERSPEEAKRLLLVEIAATARAEAARPKSFEEQLARVRGGARIVMVQPVRRADPTMTLGGIATGAL